jgi:hypothetical protein
MVILTLMELQGNLQGILQKLGRLAKLYPSEQQNQLVAGQNETGN